MKKIIIALVALTFGCAAYAQSDVPVQQQLETQQQQEQQQLLEKQQREQDALAAKQQKQTEKLAAQEQKDQAKVVKAQSNAEKARTKAQKEEGKIGKAEKKVRKAQSNLEKVQNMELFDWLKTLYEIWKNLDHDVIRLSSLTGMGELMKNGCTTCFDHHYVFPAGAGDLLGTQFAAADELGIRMYCSRGSMDLSKKDGGLPPDSVVQTVDEIMKDSARVIEKYHDPSYGAMHRVALAPCSPFSVSADLLRESAVLARQYGVRLHTHLCETKDEENYMLAREGVRPLEYMERLGWTGSDVWYAHGIHRIAELLDVGGKSVIGCWQAQGLGGQPAYALAVHGKECGIGSRDDIVAFLL